MCGIAGILLASQHRDAALLRAIEPMTCAMVHRGPDGEGFWVDRNEGVAFGHRRLAIIDLSPAGQQPMSSPQGRYMITYNGEIYNFPELRRQLEQTGTVFTGSSDTEVLLAAIEAWGLERTLEQISGMFAFALWDRVQRRLHLARDRMGKKPLYIARAGRALLFASELKAICTNADFQRNIDQGAAVAMLELGWVPDDQCIWRDCFKLPPGTSLSLSARELDAYTGIGELRERVNPWWSLEKAAMVPAIKPDEMSPAEMTHELDRLIRQAVRGRMLSDVPVGAFLSGGTDSSVVVALMQAESVKPVRTFTIAFREGGFDESAKAAGVARHLRTDHTELPVTSRDAIETIPQLPAIWDEPFADESQIPTLLVSRLARKHVTVALSGDGGDECFAGYQRHFLSAQLSRLMKLPTALRKGMGYGTLLLARMANSDLAARAPLSPAMRHRLRGDRLARLANLLASNDEQDLFARLTGGAGLSSGTRSRATSAPLRFGDAVARMQYDDMSRYLPGDILVKLDRATMSASLEARCPLLDHRIVEFAWRLPLAAKVRDGRGKLILREVLSRYLPDDLIDLPKQGLDVPVGAWLRGPLRDWADDLIGEFNGDSDGLINPQLADARWRDHLAGRRDCSGEIWPILMFQAWRRENRLQGMGAKPEIVPHAATGW